MLAKDGFMEYVKDGHKKDVWEKINRAENFFKHADRDHDATLEFSPDQSEFLILEACGVYYKLSGEFPPLFKLYQTWFISNHQNWFDFPEEQKQLVSMGAEEVIALGREQYFSRVLPMLMKFST